MTLKVIYQDIKAVESEAIVVGFFEDVRPLRNLAGQLDWLLCGSLSRLIIEKKIRGALGEVALLTNRGKISAQKIFLVGLGPQSNFSRSTLKRVTEIVAAIVAGTGVLSAALEYFSPPNTDHNTGFLSVRDGLKESDGQHSLTISLVAPDRAAYDQLSRLVGQGQ